PTTVGAAMSWHPGDDGLILVAEHFECEDYEWCATDLWHDPMVRKYYLYEGVGCSCNTPYDNLTGLADLTEVYGLTDLTSKVNLSPRDKARFVAEYCGYRSQV